MLVKFNLKVEIPEIKEEISITDESDMEHIDLFLATINALKTIMRQKEIKPKSPEIENQ